MDFVLRRLAAAVPVLLGVTVLAFLLIHLVPGDPATVVLFGSNATPQQIADLRRSLGLDRRGQRPRVHVLLPEGLLRR